MNTLFIKPFQNGFIKQFSESSKSLISIFFLNTLSIPLYLHIRGAKIVYVPENIQIWCQKIGHYFYEATGTYTKSYHLLFSSFLMPKGGEKSNGKIK